MSSNKEVYGEIFTPRVCIDMMLSMLPKHVFHTPHTWLDPAAGKGQFGIAIRENVSYSIHESLYMYEINNEYEIILQKTFPEISSSIHMTDFLKCKINDTYDITIGNPPYNVAGKIKVPTNALSDKKRDGITVWPEFVRKCIDITKENGYVCMIVPSIWLKPDKAKINETILSYHILGIRSFTASETKQMFKTAQIPTTIFVIQKSTLTLTLTSPIPIYDRIEERFVEYTRNVNQNQTEMILPMYYPSIIEKLKPLVARYGHMKVIKTNMPPKQCVVHENENGTYIGIDTSVYDKTTQTYVFKTRRSNVSYPYQNEKKIIMAHKQHLIPYYDRTGKYGISNRDNYIILQNEKSDLEMERIVTNLSLPIIQKLCDTTRYRMRYLEKYIFELLPDMSNIHNEYILNKYTL